MKYAVAYYSDFSCEISIGIVEAASEVEACIIYLCQQDNSYDLSHLLECASMDALAANICSEDQLKAIKI